MLKKSYRLSARIGLSGSFHLINSLFTLRYAKSEFKESRFAFIVSKKVSSKAVVRNRVRRQISEAIRGLLLDIKPGYNLIFTVKKDLQTKTTAEIYIEVKKALQKAELIK